MRNAAEKALLFLTICAVLMGCSSSCSIFGTKPWSERTPKEKSSYFMAIYEKQFDDTLAMAQKPNLTEDQRKIIRTKKAILEKIWVAMWAYDDIVTIIATDNIATDNVIKGEILTRLLEKEKEVMGLLTQIAEVK